MITRELVNLVKVGCIATGVTLIVIKDFGLVVKVEGSSMQPTFNPNCGYQQMLGQLKPSIDKGMNREFLTKEFKTRLQQDKVFLNKWVARDKTLLKIGDVVILTSPRDPSKKLIKRIIAMPGDVIFLIEADETLMIKEGHCWVEGDNNHASFDSNVFGQVPLGLIEGKVCFIVWPLNRIRMIENDPSISSNSSKTSLITNSNQKSQPT